MFDNVSHNVIRSMIRPTSVGENEIDARNCLILRRNAAETIAADEEYGSVTVLTISLVVQHWSILGTGARFSENTD